MRGGREWEGRGGKKGVRVAVCNCNETLSHIN